MAKNINANATIDTLDLFATFACCALQFFTPEFFCPVLIVPIWSFETLDSSSTSEVDGTVPSGETVGFESVDTDVALLLVGGGELAMDGGDVVVLLVEVNAFSCDEGDIHTRTVLPDAAASATPLSSSLLYETAAILLDNLLTNGRDQTSCVLTEAPPSLSTITES